MRVRIWIFAAALFIASFAMSRAQEAADDPPSFTCGLNAAYIFLNKTGHHVPYDELTQDFKKQNPPDSLLAIKNVLGEHDCATVGVKTDADYFLNNRGPAIIHLQLVGYSARPENHFTYLVGATRQTGVEVLDPVFNVKTSSHISWMTFAQSYQGAALILK
jgi:ABC-type bacteriocin/lantibiotic exporter with double-glycine peptidase domain